VDSQGGWDRKRIECALYEATFRPGSVILPGWLAGRNKTELQLVTKEVKN